MSRPSHFCICQYIQHPLPLLVKCSIPSASRCGHVWMSSFQYSSHRVLGSLLVLSLVCSLCWYSFLINTIKNLFLCKFLWSTQFTRFKCSCHKFNLFPTLSTAINSQSKMTICNTISYENIKQKKLKLSISLNIYSLDSPTFISLSLISMSHKSEIDNCIRLHSRTWTSSFFPDSSVVFFLFFCNVVLFKETDWRKSPVFGVSLSRIHCKQLAERCRTSQQIHGFPPIRFHWNLHQ
jgi:hypothetical protein